MTFITEVCGDTLGTACVELDTLITGVVDLLTGVFGTVTNLLPAVVVMVFPVATAFSNFLNLPLYESPLLISLEKLLQDRHQNLSLPPFAI